MRIKFAISLGAVVLLLIALVWLSNNREKSKLDLVAQVGNTNALAMDNTVLSSVGKQQTDTNIVAATTPAGQAAPARVDSVAINEKIRAEIEAKNVPFDFYGRAIDQDSNALSGVKFKLAVRHWSTTTLGAIHIERETDADGRFDIHGETGDAFDVENVGKAGYELEPGQRTFGVVGGSIESPVVFKMWSTNVHEQLITGGQSFHIEPDSRPYVIDLAKGTIAESGAGDLKVWVKRPKLITYGKRYDWSCEMDVLNGGLLAASDASMYLAPADGYTPSFQFEQKVGSGWGDSTGEKRFYVRLNNGAVYGRITIELFAYYNDRVPGMVRIQYALNPSGSRVLR